MEMVQLSAFVAKSSNMPFVSVDSVMVKLSNFNKDNELHILNMPVISVTLEVSK